MHRWERRLADAAHALTNCGATYFEPELFRRNVNHFLTTARTITFLIAKDKATIPDYERWISNEVGKYWSGDTVMKWAKDSRNFIEKEGDLDLYSSLSVSLIYSYFEKNDLSIEVGRTELVRGSIKTLMSIAEKSLPPGISDASAVKIDRRWVANTLPDYELFQALIYVYNRYYKACETLSTYLKGKLSENIPTADEMAEPNLNGLRCRYVKFSDRDSYTLKSHRVERDRSQTRPSWLSEIDMKRSKFDIYTEMARNTFIQFGNHVSMIFLFSNENKVLKHLCFAPADQVDKFIFCRNLAEQVIYLRAESLIFIAEAWLRKNGSVSVPMRNLEIVGEALQVYEINRNGKAKIKSWKIVRDNENVSLDLDEEAELDASAIPNFLIPINDAFARVHEKHV